MAKFGLWSKSCLILSHQIWNYTRKHEELDLVKGKQGNELDELNAHRFLEAFDETMTVREMRNQLRAKGALKVGTDTRLRGLKVPFAVYVADVSESSYSKIIITCRSTKLRRRFLLLTSWWFDLMWIFTGYYVFVDPFSKF